MELNERLKDEMDVAKQARDELRLQLHLGAAEAKEVFESLEHKWAEVDGMLRRVAHEVEKPLHDIQDSAQALVDEIRNGYERVKSLL